MLLIMVHPPPHLRCCPCEMNNTHDGYCSFCQGGPPTYVDRSCSKLLALEQHFRAKQCHGEVNNTTTTTNNNNTNNNDDDDMHPSTCIDAVLVPKTCRACCPCCFPLVIMGRPVLHVSGPQDMQPLISGKLKYP